MFEKFIQKKKKKSRKFFNENYRHAFDDNRTEKIYYQILNECSKPDTKKLLFMHILN